MAGERDVKLRKELAILIVLGREEAVENGGLGVVRIAELIGREKSQVSRAGEQRLLGAAPALLERLMKSLGETAHLSVLQGVEVLTVFSKSPPHAVTAVGWSGRT